MLQTTAMTFTFEVVIPILNVTPCQIALFPVL